MFTCCHRQSKQQAGILHVSCRQCAMCRSRGTSSSLLCKGVQAHMYVKADKPTSNVCMACAKASGDGLHRKPVISCRTLSVGPPLSQAMTGLPDAIASKGTMPKCSFCGVYSTAVHAANRAARCSSVNEGSKNTWNMRHPINTEAAL